MALIICPECGKEISDKSTQCIHCGFPLNTIETKPTNNTICTINGVQYDLLNEFNLLFDNNIDNARIKAIGQLRRKTSLTLTDGIALIDIMQRDKQIPAVFAPQRPLGDREKLYGNHTTTLTQIQCPYCKSTNTKKITATSKAVHTALFGIFSMGRNSKQWHCDNCGSDF